MNVREYSAICFDSRQVVPGCLFVAQNGTNVDGRRYIDAALAAGAREAVVDEDGRLLGQLAAEYYDYPSRKLHLVGVTGTNGKTTIATLLYRMVQAMGHKAGLISTVAYYVGDTQYPSTHTTPDAVTLNRLMAEMVEAGCEYCFMEVSSHAIAQHRIEGLTFEGALFTNLTRDHIDYHKTFDNYRDTKKQLFDSLPKTAFAVTNADDRNGLVMTQNCRAHITTYSTRAMADYRAQILEEGFDGMLLNLCGHEVFVPLVGRFNVSNLLCIYGAAVNLGFEPMEVLRILSTLHPVNGRFETIHSAKGWTAIIDYAHTPDAVENVLNTINEIGLSPALSGTLSPKGERKIICVIGCGGNRDKGKRPMMAKIAKQNSTHLILTSDNPRDEEPMDILNDMLAGLTPEEQQDTLVIEDRAMAIRMACQLATAGDVILVAGKGHEDYQIIKGVKSHFDDHEQVRRYV